MAAQTKHVGKNIETTINDKLLFLPEQILGKRYSFELLSMGTNLYFTEMLKSWDYYTKMLQKMHIGSFGCFHFSGKVISEIN